MAGVDEYIESSQLPNKGDTVCIEFEWNSPGLVMGGLNLIIQRISEGKLPLHVKVPQLWGYPSMDVNVYPPQQEPPLVGIDEYGRPELIER